MGKQTCKYGIWGFHNNNNIAENTWVVKQNANHLGKSKKQKQQQQQKEKHADVQTRV